MELRDALAQISEIRMQVARTETFRGYRSATVAFSAALAFVASAIQAAWIPEPSLRPGTWLALWIAAAAWSLAATGVEMAIRCRRTRSPYAAQLTCLAIEQFLPCVLAGGLLTGTIYCFADEALWMLPGLWSVLFSLGIFASCRLLPRPIPGVAFYFLLGGIVSLVLARGEAAFSPWAMCGTFGVGQLATALILYLELERGHG